MRTTPPSSTSAEPGPHSDRDPAPDPDPLSAVDALLAAARERIAPRVTAGELDAQMAAGAIVVDTRPAELRQRDGELPGAVVLERNVLEWRLDPSCPHRLAQMASPDQMVVVVCDEGYASSLAAASLRELGLAKVTDLAGGFQAWRALRREERPTF